MSRGFNPHFLFAIKDCLLREAFRNYSRVSSDFDVSHFAFALFRAMAITCEIVALKHCNRDRYFLGNSGFLVLLL